MSIDVKDSFLKLCVNKMYERGCIDDAHKERLREELKEIETQMEFDYFLDLFKEDVKFPTNDNNLLVPYLLGLVEQFDIDKPSIFIQGEYPDIDVDYLPDVRDYLRNVWVPETFGKDNVCAIGNYTTFGIKSSLIDMVRVHSKDRNEILALTTKIGLKDDDGKVLTWKKALETYKELKEYCDRNPEVANAAERLLNRNRGTGKHAAGLIISKSRIDNLVPLVRNKDGNFVSAFVEGLHGTDLGPLGLIKFDLLGIINLLKIANCCRMIKERHGIQHICAMPDQPDWSDTSYLDDPKALALANEGKLKCIFQFDSQGIRELVKKGGVSSFEDLTAYSALYRPGPMGMGMHDVYVNRKRGKEKYSLHPMLQDILGNTYGVMCYQEQVMKILRHIGGVPDMHCEIVRKAISKKKIEVFSKYKEMFLINGQKILGWNLEQVTDFWNQIESFAEYGFNKSHAVAYTYISSRLLWLKAHYPTEFFAAILSCEDSANKIKEYKTEAESMGIKLNRVDINKSKMRFSIIDDTIYMGFSNIKGIGDDVAERIVAGQPYTSLQDFLERFGTDARVLEPLIALNVFGEDQDSVKLHEYYQYYKSEHKKIEDRRSRYGNTCDKYVNQIKDILELSITSSPEYIMSLEGMLGSTDEEQMEFQKEELVDVEFAKQILNKYQRFEKEQKEDFLSAILEDYKIIDKEADQIWNVLKKYKRSLDGFEKKEVDGYLVPFNEFNFRGKVGEKIEQALREPRPVIESVHYGFSWQHLLEFSSDYNGGCTFSDFDEDETALIGMVEVHIIEKPKSKKSKKGTEYFIVKVEDANSRSEMIIFWEDDYIRFREELEFWQGDSLKGNLLKMRVKKPDDGFTTYGFDAPMKTMRHLYIPKDKADDARIIVMSRPKMAAPIPVKSKENRITSPIIIE